MGGPRRPETARRARSAASRAGGDGRSTGAAGARTPPEPAAPHGAQAAALPVTAPVRRRATTGACAARAAAGDRLARLVERPLIGRWRLRRFDAQGGRHGRRRPPARQPLGERHELRALRGLVARARSPARTSSTSSGSTGCRSAGRTATRSTRSFGRRAAAARPRRIPANGEGCSAGADRRRRS